MRFLLLMVAAAIAVFAGIVALQLPGKNSAAAPVAAAPAMERPTVATVDVYVARSAIAPGTVITAALIDKQPWPENLVLEGFITSGKSSPSIIGKVARATFQPREPLIASKLASTGDAGFMAATLPAGMRAITIATDAITGVAGYIFPGDHVDVLFTHNIPSDIKAMQPHAVSTMGAGAVADKPAYAEVAVSNALVLAVNVREGVAKEESNGGGMVGAVAMAIPMSSPSPSSMTLEVSDIDAEKIRLAERVGALSLSLRSLDDRNNTAIAAPTALTALTQIGQTDAALPEMHDNSVTVIRGAGGYVPAAANPK